MKFLKENSYDVVKLFVNQIGSTIFCLALYLCAGMASGELVRRLMYIFSIFATLFYCALLYTASWDMGARDKVRIDSGKYKKMSAKGVVLSLLANIPNLVLAILASVFSLVGLISGTQSLQGVVASLIVIMRFILSPFHGIVQLVVASVPSGAVYAMWESASFLVLLVIPVIATQLGYSFGMRNFRMFSFMSGKKQDK